MPTGSRSSAAISATEAGNRVSSRIATCSDCMPAAGSDSATTSVTRSKGFSGPVRVRPWVMV